MTIEHLIQLTENRIANLEKALTESFGMGDLARYTQVEQELEESKTTCARLVKKLKSPDEP